MNSELYSEEEINTALAKPAETEGVEDTPVAPPMQEKSRAEKTETTSDE